ncbi:nitroreductase family deazaflavin-dependent oxidoreductase [Micromonospora sp. NPDC002296]|uniref:nitroreductase family deazaflavin-dependent oxidoreductase n=1 Tax=Micromonospora sp. NPDC002296 TaxID=3154271 RepID=UPI003319C654
MTQEETTAPAGYQDFQNKIIAEFRANGGKVGGMFEGATLCLLTTVGARSGEHRTTPLGYLEVDGQPLVVASAGGAPNNPAWYYNVLKNPRVTVEVGNTSYEAVAEAPTGEERDRLFAGAVQVAPGYGDYQAKTTRSIPVVVLRRVDV